jgi:hypothetical protein
LKQDCSRGIFEHPAAVKHRRALGALFFLLAIGFAGVAYGAATGARHEAIGWVIASAAAALAVWLGSMAIRALKAPTGRRR